MASADRPGLFHPIAQLPINPIQLDYSGQFKQSAARAGVPLDFEVFIKGISGFSQPLAGLLTVNCSQLNYQDSKPITLLPLVENRFLYTIPIGNEAQPGIYRLEVNFQVNGMNLLTQQHSINLPDAQLLFSIPGNTTTFNAGDTFTLNMENIGGKTGNFDLKLSIKDSFNKVVFDHQGNLSLTPGSSSQKRDFLHRAHGRQVFFRKSKNQKNIDSMNEKCYHKNSYAEIKLKVAYGKKYVIMVVIFSGCNREFSGRRRQVESGFVTDLITG